jgi:hypothetical protein
MHIETEVLVIGGNPGGCSAAIAAARSGRRVILMEPTKTLGGINANGTFGFDTASPHALSGIAKEVEARVRAHYACIGLHDPLFERRADQVWESHVATKIWRDLVEATPGISVLWGAVPVDVIVRDGMIDQVHWQQAIDAMGNVDPDGRDFNAVHARMVIDASYEGDVAAWSGVPVRLGREARSWQEPHAGKLYTTNMEHGDDGTMPHSVLPGSTGEADDAIMAYAFRLHCRVYDDSSSEAPHRLKTPPPGYDAAKYAWAPVATAGDGSPVYFDSLYVLVNGKFLLNRMVRGNNLAGPSRAYILAHPRQRKALRQQFLDHSLGYLYFIQNDGGMPQLGLAHDEFIDNHNIPYQLYVREGRRIEGEQTLTEADITPYITGDGMRPPCKPDAVAIGDWTLESQGCSDSIPSGYRNPEGFIFNRVVQTPFQIPYGCLLPKGIRNLLVPGALSSTHIGMTAVRCEAARIQTGIAAGVAAGMSIALQCSPAEVPLPALQEELISRGGKLTYFSDVEGDHPHFASIQWAALRGLVPPDGRWRFFPEHPATWAGFAEAAVICLQLPISVTGAHFEGIDRRHHSFRYIEALYDLGTRAGIDLFDSKNLRDEGDPMLAILRLQRGPRLIPFTPDASLSTNAAARFLALVSQAQTGKAVSVGDLVEGLQYDSTLLTRAMMCRLLKAVDERRASVTGGLEK